MKSRRQLLKGAATAASLPILGAQHAHTPSDSSKPADKPKVLNSAEIDSLANLVNLIIPRSDTPGASDARVHFFIDRSLHLRKSVAQYREGRKALDALSRDRHRRAFDELDPAQRIAVLTAASQNPESEAGRFFVWVKNMTIDGYYSSREGLVQELGWKGNTYLTEFKGCTHPEHQG